jgi:hypothetical protein
MSSIRVICFRSRCPALIPVKLRPGQLELDFTSGLHCHCFTLRSFFLSLAQPLLNLTSGYSCSAQLNSGSRFWDPER